ncbi:MAG: PAS domain S-box protein, partial [Bacteroidales bacterium]|nr:PAS domain S-box protein [Bacteroidales bacterium]
MRKLKNMGYNRFYINIFLNVILITATCLAFVYFLFIRDQPATTVLFGFIAIFFTGRLIYYINRTNRMLDNFIIFMKEHDPTLAISSRFVKKTFHGFYHNLQEIKDEMKEDRIEKEIQTKYLHTIVENVQTGIVTINKNGEVELINKAAKDYLGVTQLRHLSELNKTHSGLAARIRDLNPGEQILEKLTTHGKTHYLSIKGSFIKSKGEPYTIITFNDIKNELEEQEIHSWKKLIRIITHEIMNSITPITTLTSAIKRKLNKGKGKRETVEYTPLEIQDALSGMDIIEERSQGVIHFISQYRKLTKLPPLQITGFVITDLFNKIEYLFKEQLIDSGIRFNSDVRNIKVLHADKKMVEQMLINLVKNAIEALDSIHSPFIELK